MIVVLCIFVALVALSVGFGVGWWLCAKSIPKILSELDTGQLKALASQVDERRKK